MIFDKKMAYASIVVTPSILFSSSQRRVIDDNSTKQTNVELLLIGKHYSRSHATERLLVSTFIVLLPFVYIP